MRVRARVDANQSEIVAALRKVGRTVVLLHQAHDGIPDLLVGYQGYNFLLEVKVLKGKLTPDQVKFFDTWRGHKTVVTSPHEAILATEPGAALQRPLTQHTLGFDDVLP